MNYFQRERERVHLIQAPHLIELESGFELQFCFLTDWSSNAKSHTVLALHYLKLEMGGSDVVCVAVQARFHRPNYLAPGFLRMLANQ